MPEKLHAFDYLHDPARHAAGAVCVVYGDESFLRGLVLERIRAAVLGEEEEDGDSPYASFEGNVAEWRDVHDEVATASLFGGGARRLAIVDDTADTSGAKGFVSRYRQQLEDYVAKPSKVGVLVLVVASFPANTRLYKAVDKSGLAVQCSLPEKGGRSKAIDETRVLKWLGQRAKEAHGIKLESEALAELFALTGGELGLAEQNLAKLALYVEKGEKVGPEMVRDIVGGWRAKSMWELGDAIAAGDAAAALEQLDHVRAAEEHPNAIFGQLAWSLRRYAAAAAVIDADQSQKKRVDMKGALQQAGFYPAQLAQAESQLRQLGSGRANKLYRWLLETDLTLKGTHSQPRRGYLELEKLVVRMSRETAPARPPKPGRTPR